MTTKQGKGQQGVALMMTIWILVLLGIMAVQFAQSMRMELQITRNSRDEVQLYYLAMAAFQLAIAEILAPYTGNALAANGEVIFIRDNSDLPQADETEGSAYTDMWGQLGTEESEEFLTSVNYFIGHRSQFEVQSGRLSYTITDEDGKFNLNSIMVRDQFRPQNAELFRKLLIETGIEDGMQADTIVDSVVDWLDSDDFHRGNGAESDYYEKEYREQGMLNPYKCKNGAFTTVEELLLVKGITPEILYGTRALPQIPGQDADAQDEVDTYLGLYPHLTVFTPTGSGIRTINRNTATDLILKVINPDNAETVIGDRRDRGVIAARNVSRYFTVQATGYMPRNDVSRTIKAVVFKTNPRRASRISIRYWKDNARYVAPNEQLFLDFTDGTFIIPNR